MKQTLLIPFRYIFFCIVLVACICGYLLLVNSVRYQSIAGSQELLFFNLVKGLKISLLLAGLLSVFFLISFILRTEMRKGLALFLLFLVSTPSFLFGYYALRQLDENNFGDMVVSLNWLTEETILRFSGGAVYLGDIEPDALESVILYHHGSLRANPFDETETDYEFVELDPDIQRLNFITSLPYKSDSMDLTIPVSPAREDVIISNQIIENSRNKLFFEFFLPGNVFRLFENLFKTLDSYAATLSLHYVVLIVALFLFLFSTVLFLRMTRWPLINQIFALFINMGGLLLTRVHEIPEIQNFVTRFLSEQAVNYVSAVFLGLFALFFVIINAFQPSLTEWAGEVNG